MTFKFKIEDIKDDRTYIATHRGLFYPFNLEDQDFNIENIAHALSLLCRYNGHCREFYSVAQHSVLVASLVPDHLKLQALLHDASEAFISDVPKPIKRRLPDVQDLENSIERAIFRYYDLNEEMDPAIHHADVVMLLTESEQLHDQGHIIYHEVVNKYGSTARPLKDLIINPLEPKAAKDLFMNTYLELTA